MRSASKTAARKSPRGGPGRANLEIEIKLRIPDRRRLSRQLARLKAKLTGARVHEMNTLYDTAEGNLSRHGRMLRIRVERPASRSGRAGKSPRIAGKNSGFSTLLTYKGPGPLPGRLPKRATGPGGAGKHSKYKIREERELRVADGEEMPRILEALGFRPWFRYEKFRSTYRLPGMKRLKLEIDETPIGLFVELEGRRGEIDRAAGVLGFTRAEYIDKSYGALFMEERGAGRRAASGVDSGSGRGSGKRSKTGSHNEPVPFSGLPDMLFRGSK